MINIKENEELNVLNHSCAHLMAQAIKRLYPNALFWVGPVIEEGFYYDIDLGNEVIKEEDLPKIEREMKKISKDGKRIVRRELSKDEALELFKNDIYKIDLINNMSDDEIITCYSQGEFTDLCRGPHVETVKVIKNYKLLKTSGAYYKGDSKNKMLTRIYGVCFNNEEDLKTHLQLLEDAKNNDHRKIGKELNLFCFDELVGPGLPMWLSNGATIKRIIERYIQDKEIKLGYDHVYTPSLASVELYKTSGHWDHYKENMFPVMKMDNEELVLRPMNCPHHMLVYKNALHSYKDLPIRVGELAHDYRYEASGAVCGLERVRCMCMNDAHIFATDEQIEEEFKKVVDLILEVYKDFNITYDYFSLSLRDSNNKEKYFDDDEMWEKAENILRKVLDNLGIEYVEKIGEAAFYGPKLDVQVKSAIGHEFTLSTCQLDFLLPKKFDLTYIASDGSKKTPVVIHRAITSTTERFCAYLIERYKGAFPLWLSPTQVNIIPVNENLHKEYCEKLKNLLINNDIRVTTDYKEETFNYRLRQSNIMKNPCTVIIGDKEIKDNLVSYRVLGSNETHTLNLNEFVTMIENKINNKELI